MGVVQTTQPNESVPQNQAPEGHDERMAQIADAANKGDNVDEVIRAQKDATPAKPEWVPEKFWNAETGQVDSEGLARSYAELESKLSSNQPTLDANSSREEIESAGIDYSAVAQEYIENDGELSEETYKALAKDHGLSKEVVDAHIDGQVALQEQMVNNVHHMVGGEEAYVEMIKWAAQNLSDEDREYYDNAVTNGSPAEVNQAVQALAYVYQQEVGSPLDSVTAAAQQHNVMSDQLFRSQDEYINAMSDRRYKTDPVYRRDVSRRMAASHDAGLI